MMLTMQLMLIMGATVTVMINQNAESEVGKKRTSKRGFWTDTVWCVGCDSHILPGFP